MLKKFRDKIKEKIKKFFDNEKVIDFLNVIKFVLIHGFLGLFILLIIISIIGIDFIITKMIRESWTLTILIFLIGSGAGYYMLLDISKYISELRGNKG